MLGPPSDSNTAEGHESQPRTSFVEPAAEPSTHDSTELLLTHFDSDKSEQLREALDRLARLGLHPTDPFPPSALPPSSLSGQPRLCTQSDNMAAPVQPVFDDHEDSDYDDLSSSRSSEAYSPRFKPSLPALGNRVVTPDHTEPDMLSLSGDTVSNADTVSDQFDREDSIESFDYIRHEDIPDDLRGTQSDTEEMDEGIMMSDHTIVPATPTLSQRLPGITAVMTSPLVERTNDDGATIKRYQTVGFCKADKPYSIPDRPMLLLFVAAEDMAEEDQIAVIAKIMSAAAAEDISPHVIAKATDLADDSDAQPFHQRYEIAPSEAKSITVCVDHAVAYSYDERKATLASQTILDMSTGPMPDFAVFLHVSQPQRLAPLSVDMFPRGEQGHLFARALSKRHVPLLELCVSHEQASWTPSVMTSTHEATAGLPFFHAREILRSRSTATPVKIGSLQVPVSLNTFIKELDNEDLSCHLAWISKQHEGKPAIDNKSTKGTFTGWAASPWLRNFTSTFPILMLVFYAAVLSIRYSHPDLVSHQALRREELSQALNKSGITTVNATSIIHYPTTTRVVSGTTSVGLTYPTGAEIHVAKSDQLFVALPRRSPAHVGLTRNGKAIADVDVTKVVEGVYEIDLKAAEAYGQVQVEVFTSKTPPINQTIKIDLGNRLLHRGTYERAARDVQSGIQRDVEEVHTAAKAVQARLINNTQSALKLSFYRANALRNRMLASSANMARQLSREIYSFTNTTSTVAHSTAHILAIGHAKNVQLARGMVQLTKNTTLAVGSAIGSTLPAKKDLARARSNSLKLREKLYRSHVVPPPSTIAANSTLARLAHVGRDMGLRYQLFYANSLRPKIGKLFERPDKALDGQGPAATGLTKLHEPLCRKKCSDTGLSCQKKCSKKVNGGITCNKCSPKHKLDGLKTAKQVEEGK